MEKICSKLARVRVEMQGVTFVQIVERLTEVENNEKEVSVAKKLSRRELCAAFKFACLRVIGTEHLHLA